MLPVGRQPPMTTCPRAAQTRLTLNRGVTGGFKGRSKYPSGEGRLPSVGLMWRDCAVVQTPVFAPVQETVRWQASRYWLVPSGVAGGASSRGRRRPGARLQPAAPGRSRTAVSVTKAAGYAPPVRCRPLLSDTCV